MRVSDKCAEVGRGAFQNNLLAVYPLICLPFKILKYRCITRC